MRFISSSHIAATISENISRPSSNPTLTTLFLPCAVAFRCLDRDHSCQLPVGEAGTAGANLVVVGSSTTTALLLDHVFHIEHAEESIVSFTT
jgi:hypothetical protein